MRKGLLVNLLSKSLNQCLLCWNIWIDVAVLLSMAFMGIQETQFIRGLCATVYLCAKTLKTVNVNHLVGVQLLLQLVSLPAAAWRSVWITSMLITRRGHVYLYSQACAHTLCALSFCLHSSPFGGGVLVWQSLSLGVTALWVLLLLQRGRCCVESVSSVGVVHHSTRFVFSVNCSAFSCTVATPRAACPHFLLLWEAVCWPGCMFCMN